MSSYRGVSPALSVAVLQAKQHRQVIGATAAILAATALAALLLAVLPGSLALGMGAVIMLPAVLMWLWRQPVRGIYSLVAAAVLLDVYQTSPTFSDDIGRFVPFFEDLATWTHVKGLSFSLAELFMLLVLVIWLLKGIAEHTFRFEKGSLMRPLGLYMLMVLIGEAHGLASGGDMRLSLWEIRSQVYLFVAYILACNLIRSRKQIDLLVWILILGAGLKGIQGTWRYLITLHGHLTVEAIFPHEQSFFFDIFLTAIPIFLLFGCSRRLKRAALYLLPFVIMANLANQRRAAIIALALGALGVLVITLVAYAPRRRAVVKTLLLLVVVLPPYYLAFSHQSGMIAGPARAIGSAFHPDPRDASSNQYRVNEDRNILATMSTSPLIGYGFGKEMLRPYPLADISNLYIYWLILPHNSILWVWMRLGTLGYLLLWFTIGLAIVQAAELVRRLRDPSLKGVALLILVVVMQEMVFGYLDLQWTNYRNMIVMGVLLAVLGRLSSVGRTSGDGAPAKRQIPARSPAREVPLPPTHTLAGANNR